jgi:hypothetical protein
VTGKAEYNFEEAIKAFCQENPFYEKDVYLILTFYLKSSKEFA